MGLVTKTTTSQKRTAYRQLPPLRPQLQQLSHLERRARGRPRLTWETLITLRQKSRMPWQQQQQQQQQQCQLENKNICHDLFFWRWLKLLKKEERLVCALFTKSSRKLSFWKKEKKVFPKIRPYSARHIQTNYCLIVEKVRFSTAKILFNLKTAFLWWYQRIFFILTYFYVSGNFLKKFPVRALISFI